MKAVWIAKGRARSLLVVFNGFGMDQVSLSGLSAPEHDLVILQDYRSLQLDQETLEQINSYPSIDVLAWSLGVWVYSLLAHHFVAKRGMRVAINGTLFPIDRQRGIALPIFAATVAAFADPSGAGQAGFYQNVFAERPWLFPQRVRIEQHQELCYLQEQILKHQSSADYVSPERGRGLFDKAIVATRDQIVRPSNQKLAWQGLTTIQEVEGAHYLFDVLSCWRDIVAN